MEIEDPYEYRDRLTLPKFMIYACGDQSFLPDSSQFYFDDLPGPKYLRYVPNTDHALKNSDALQTLEACYHAMLTGAKLPQCSWTQEKNSTIEPEASVTFVGEIETPTNGWAAFFVDLTFPSGSPSPFKFTTRVQVLPDKLPFKFEGKNRSN